MDCMHEPIVVQNITLKQQQVDKRTVIDRAMKRLTLNPIE